LNAVPRPRRVVLRALAGVALLAGLWAWLEPAAILAEVGALSPGWALLAVVMTLPPLGLSAWRWRFTARRLGLALGWRRALLEYAQAQFLNQVLPGGVAGDATRAWRHARHSGRRAGAWRAVIIERASGQLAMALLTLAALASPLWWAPLGRLGTVLASPSGLTGGMALVVAVAGPAAWLRGRPPAALAGLTDDLRHSLLGASAWPRQLAGSLLVGLCYALVFVCAARAIGVTTPSASLLALAPPVLVAMLVPLSVAGWGVREGAAALAWGLVGLPPAQGMAVSLAYGVLVLLASLPGGLCLAWSALARRRTGHAGSGGGGGDIAEVQVEEGIVTAAEGPCPRAPGLVQGRDRRHGQAGASGADQQRCHQQVQAVEHAGLQETRHRDAAALDQHPAQAALCQGGEHRGGGEAVGRQGQRQAGDVLRHTPRRCLPLAVQVQGGGLGVAQQVAVGAHSPPGVEDHAHRLGAGDVADRQPRVIRDHGAGAHHHGVHQGAQAMQVHEAGLAVDVVGVAALGGDASVQALAELGHGPGPGAGGELPQAIEEFGVLGRRGDRQSGLVAGRMGRGEQRLPGDLGRRGDVRVLHGTSGGRVSRHHAQSAGSRQKGDSDATG
jgi:glycosyltransferase 2 family protein